MLQVPWIVRVEKIRMHYFDFLVVRTSVVEWAVEWLVKKPLGHVQKAGDRHVQNTFVLLKFFSSDYFNKFIKQFNSVLIHFYSEIDFSCLKIEKKALN